MIQQYIHHCLRCAWAAVGLPWPGHAPCAQHPSPGHGGMMPLRTRARAGIADRLHAACMYACMGGRVCACASRPRPAQPAAGPHGMACYGVVRCAALRCGVQGAGLPAAMLRQRRDAAGWVGQACCSSADGPAGAASASRMQAAPARRMGHGAWRMGWPTGRCKGRCTPPLHSFSRAMNGKGRPTCVACGM